MNRETNNSSNGGDALRVLDRACDAALFGDAPSAEELLEAREQRGKDLPGPAMLAHSVRGLLSRENIQAACERFGQLRVDAD